MTYAKSIVCFALVTALTSSFAAKFSYKYDYRSQQLGRITFSNKEALIQSKDPEDGYGEAILMEMESGSRIKTEVLNDYASLRAGYTDLRSAKYAVISSNCGGTMCSWTDLYFAYLHEDRIVINKIGSVTTKNFKLEIDSSTNKVVAFGVDSGTNAYGDLTTETRYLIPGRGFTGPGFKKEYEKFAMEHPDKFLGDSKLREPLAKVIGLDNFKGLRGAMSGPGETKIDDGRFLAMSACMAHACPSANGAILVDATNGQVWAAWVDDATGAVKSGTTAKWNDRIGFKLADLLTTRSNPITYANGKFGR